MILVPLENGIRPHEINTEDVMFSIIGITGRVGGGAASRLLGLGKQVRAVVRDEAKGHVWASKGASVAVADITDSDGLGRAIAGSEAVFVMLPPLFDPSPGFPEAKGQIDSLSVALRRSEQSESLLFRRLVPTSPGRICSIATT